MKQKWLLITMIAANAASCTESLKEEAKHTGTAVPLTLSVRTDLSDTRSLITDTCLGAGEEIGVFLTDEQGKAYDGIQYSNIRFRSSGTAASQSWNADNEIMLSASKAILHAYYPYSPDVTDIEHIPLICDSHIQTDYMYSEPVAGLNNHYSQAPVTLRHALTAVRIILRRGDYTGPGNITAISVSGEGIATGGFLNAYDGSISSLSGTGAVISPEISPMTLDSMGTSIDILAIPTGKESVVKIDLIMDAELFTITTDAATLSRGLITVFDISINNSSVNISPVKVKGWDLGQTISSSLQKGWNVTFDGDMEGMVIDSSVETDGSVIITVSPTYPEGEINPVTISGTVTVEEKVEDGIRTIILTGISSDVNIRFNSYSLWVSAVYNITSTTAPTSLCHKPALYSRMQIDGKEVPVDYQYQFESTGEHTARFIFPDKESIPTLAFYYTSSLKGISFPEGVKSIGTYCLCGCSNLVSVNLPQTMVSSGYDVMSNCSSLKYVSLPDDLDMGYRMFASCYSLEEVILPKNLQTMSSSTFYRCHKLRKADIPESVTKIDDNVYSSSGILSLKVPAHISELPDDFCENCTSLSSISLPAGLRSIGNNAFYNCSKLENISYTDGTDCGSCIKLKEGLVSIGSYAFAGCSMLTSLHIPSTLTNIGTGALNTGGIVSTTISSGNPAYKSIEGFNGVIKTDSSSLIFGGNNATVIPDEVTSIGDAAFYMTQITSLDLHEKISYIGNRAFYGTNALKTIISRSLIPPQIGTSEVFYQSARFGTLKVPESAVDAYMASDWMTNSTGFLGFLSWSISTL